MKLTKLLAWQWAKAKDSESRAVISFLKIHVVKGKSIYSVLDLVVSKINVFQLIRFTLSFLFWAHYNSDVLVACFAKTAFRRTWHIKHNGPMGDWQHPDIIVVLHAWVFSCDGKWKSLWMGRFIFQTHLNSDFWIILQIIHVLLVT